MRKRDHLESISAAVDEVNLSRAAEELRLAIKEQKRTTYTGNCSFLALYFTVVGLSGPIFTSLAHNGLSWELDICVIILVAFGWRCSRMATWNPAAVNLRRENAKSSLIATCDCYIAEGAKRVSPAMLEQLHDVLDEVAPETANAIVRLLASVGDKRSLWFVESIAGQTADGHLLRQSHQPELRPVAAQAAEQMRVRLTREQEAEVLLRPASVQSSPDLLRPAAAVSGHADDLLLRADTSIAEELRGRNE